LWFFLRFCNKSFRKLGKRFILGRADKNLSEEEKQSKHENLAQTGTA
jgi:hypothetical protein